MAWTGTARELTLTDFDLTQELINLGIDSTAANSRLSRALYAITDPRFNGLIHIVAGVHHQSSAFSSGLYYMQYSTATNSLRRWSWVSQPATSGGEGATDPRIAFDTKEGRVWIAYRTSANPLVIRNSSNDGASWSGAKALGSSGQYGSAISFGYNGDGIVLVFNPVVAEWQAYHYQGDEIWGSQRVLATDPSVSGNNQYFDLAVNHTGDAVVVAPRHDFTGSPKEVKMKLFKYKKSTDAWDTSTTLQTATGTSAGALFASATALLDGSFRALCATTTGAAGDVLNFYVSPGLSVNTRSTLTGGGPTGVGTWAKLAVDLLGNVHFFQKGSATSFWYKKYTADTDTWDTSWTKLEETFNYVANGPMNDYGFKQSSGAQIYSVPGAAIVFGQRLQWIIGAGRDNPFTPRSGVWTDYDPIAVPAAQDELFSNRGRIVHITEFNAVNTFNKQRRRLVIYAGDSIFHDNGEDEFVGNQIGSGAFEPIADMAVHENTLYIADGTNVLKKWQVDDATTTTVTNSWDGNTLNDPAPSPYLLENARNRLWAVEATSPTKILFSGLRDGDAWNLTGATADEDDPGFIFINDLPRGEPITAIKELHGERYIFSQNGIVEISGDTPFLGLSADTNAPPFILREVTKEVGAVSNRAMVNVGTDILFLSRKGVHSLATTVRAGTVETDDFVSAPIQDLFASFNKDLFSRAAAVNYRRKNWAVWNVAASGDGSEMKTLLVYDYARKQWMFWTFPFEIACLFVRRNPDTKKEELLAGTDRGQVMILDQPFKQDDLDGNYTAKFQSMQLHGGRPDAYKKFAKIIVYLARPIATTLAGTYWIDNHPGQTFTVEQNPQAENIIGNFTIGTNKIGGSSRLTTMPQHVIVNKRGKALVLELSSATGDFAVTGAEVLTKAGSKREVV